MCGVMACIGSRALQDTYFGLQLLQHRGQDGFGIHAQTKSEDFLIRQRGLVNRYILDTKKKYSLAIGHNRYSTIGIFREKELQPLSNKNLSICHNGNITNYDKLKNNLNYDFQTRSDVEIFHPFLEGMDETNFLEKVTLAISKIEGAYSVVGSIGEDFIFAFKDKKGIRPLFIGKSIDGFAFASESQALQFLDYSEIESVHGGEAVLIHKDRGVVFRNRIYEQESRPCMFEWVYFAGVEGNMGGVPVYQSRLNLGKMLAKKVKNLDIDIISPVPDTSRTSALALSEELGIPYREILIKNRYIQRSFILNTQQERDQALLWKLMPVVSEIKGKKILLVDDSIVRGTTSKRIIEILKKSGAASVHIASACPPLRSPCFFGVDFPDKNQLIAYQKNREEISKILGADSVIYLEESDLKSALEQKTICMGCVDGNYPYLVNELKLKEERIKL